MDTALPEILASHQQQISSSGCPQPHRPDIASAGCDHQTYLSSASARKEAVRLLKSVLSALPKEEILEILVARSSPTNCCSAAASACVSPAAAASFLNELHSTDIYHVVQQCLQESTEALPTGVCSTSASHTESGATPGPQADAYPSHVHDKGSHASSSHNHLVGMSKGILTNTEPSLSPEVDNLPSDDLRISAAEQLAARNNVACKVSSAHTDSAEFASAPSSTISSCCYQQPRESHLREATQKQRQQCSDSLHALQPFAAGSAAVDADADADSLGSMTGSTSQHTKHLHGVEALCMFLLITDGVWSLVKDVQVGVTAFLRHDCRLSFHASTVMMLQKEIADGAQSVLPSSICVVTVQPAASCSQSSMCV